MYGLSFLEENYSHQNAKKITTTHQLLGDVHHVVEILNGLQLKMSVLQWVEYFWLAWFSCALLSLISRTLDYFLMYLMFLFLALAFQEQLSPGPAAMAAALEALGEVTDWLGFMSEQQRSTISCDSWWGHEPRRDLNVQRSGEAGSGCYSCHHLFILLLFPLSFLPRLVHYQWTLLPETTGILPSSGAAAGGGDPTGLWAGGQHEKHRGAVGTRAALWKPAWDRQAQINRHQQQGWVCYIIKTSKAAAPGEKNVHLCQHFSEQLTSCEPSSSLYSLNLLHHTTNLYLCFSQGE